MSELHSRNESPQQYRAVCGNCGKEVSDKQRMHSHLKKKHVKQADGVEWDSDATQIQCNVCGNIRTF